MSAIRFIKQQLRQRTGANERDRPTHIPDQRDLLHDWFDPDETRWLLFFDGGRYDIFDQLVDDYFEGDLRRAWNGGVGYTGDWAVRNLTHDFGNRGLWCWLPLRDLQDVEYDGREWFATEPDIESERSVEERLTALGYADGPLAETVDVSPKKVNEHVLADCAGYDGGVVRYLKPHPPFVGLERLTSTSRKTERTQAALDAGELSHAELTDAYIRSYRVAFERATELVSELDGEVVLTSDHGTCLTCGQLFHGRNYDRHDHLTVVPWFEVDR